MDCGCASIAVVRAAPRNRVWIVAEHSLPSWDLKTSWIVVVYPLPSRSHNPKMCELWPRIPCRLGATPKKCVDCGCLSPINLWAYPKAMCIMAVQSVPPRSPTQTVAAYPRGHPQNCVHCGHVSPAVQGQANTAWIVVVHPVPCCAHSQKGRALWLCIPYCLGATSKNYVNCGYISPFASGPQPKWGVHCS